MRPLRATLVGVLAATALAGCGYSHQKAGPPHRSAPTQPVGAISDLSRVRCKPDEHGDWTGSGTLTNPTRKARNYDVTFAVIRPKTSEVEGKAVKGVTVRPRGAQRFSLTSFHQGDVKSGRCVFTVTLR